MVEKIVEFYRTAEDGKLPGKYDQELFDEVKKYSTSTSKGNKRDSCSSKRRGNALDCIMAFSQDPIRKLKKLDQLLKKVTADIVKIQAELEVRKSKSLVEEVIHLVQRMYSKMRKLLLVNVAQFWKAWRGSMLIDTK